MLQKTVGTETAITWTGDRTYGLTFAWKDIKLKEKFGISRNISWYDIYLKDTHLILKFYFV